MWVALANTLSGFVESTSCCTSEHSMEHALSAFHPDLPHGAGLIMLSVPYFTFFATKAPDRVAGLAAAMGVDVASLPKARRAKAFVKALQNMQKACGVDRLKMTDYGIRKADAEKYARNAYETMGGLFKLDRHALSLEETTRIIAKACK